MDSHDPFQALPAEIITEILVHTSSGDINNLRCASQVFATFQLPERFWRSRFLHGNGFSYIYAFASSWNEPATWAEKYKHAIRYHRRCRITDGLGFESFSLHNRKRTWDLAEYLNDLVKLRVSVKLRCPGMRRSATGRIEKERGEETWLTAQSNLVAFDQDFDRGTRLIYEDAVTLPNRGAITEVSVSFVSLQGKQYLSGFKFSSHQVGYHDYKTHQAVTWSGSKTVPGAIRGFYLALDDHSLRGVRIYCAPGGFSDWVGDHQDLTKQAIIHSHGSLHKMEVGLNALYIVAISTMNQDEQGPPDSVPSDDSNSAEAWPPGMWFSQFPGLPLRTAGLEDRSLWNPNWEPFQTCVFGATDGHELSRIMWIDVKWYYKYTDEGEPIENSCEIQSIRFAYDHPVEEREDCDSRAADVPILGATYERMYHYPRISPNRVRLPIAGYFGERLTAVDALYDRGLHPTLCGIILHTNWGGKLEIPKGISASNMDLGVVQIRPDGGMIVGIYGQLNHDSLIRNFGLILAPKPVSLFHRIISWLPKWFAARIGYGVELGSGSGP
ncbi:unnamed protein product [Clonostachys rosea]|uniref:DUF7600 domain-containing protein n=1 Tax=Bionectria ochroleuca TaxID=29856 RepID=A0ABY6UFU4_BIOOC|nr:unnamed protein product [Clonostachys rosea]